MGTVLFPAGKPSLLQGPPKSHWDLDTRNQGIDKGVLGGLGRGGKWENCGWLSLIRLRCKKALFYCIHLTNKKLNYPGWWFQLRDEHPLQEGALFESHSISQSLDPTAISSLGSCKKTTLTHSEFWGSRIDRPRDFTLSPNCAAINTSSSSVSRVRVSPNNFAIQLNQFTTTIKEKFIDFSVLMSKIIGITSERHLYPSTVMSNLMEYLLHSLTSP